MPGATPIGSLPIRPIKKQPRKQTKQVATNTAPASIPRGESMSGVIRVM